MKRVSFFTSWVLTAIFILSVAFCPAQDSLHYQLVIRDAAGQLVTSKPVNMKFSLMNGGQSYYEETQKTTTDKYGNISVVVGAGEKVKGSMKDVPWSTMDISLKVEADTDGGNSFKELGTVSIAAAPYALYAAQSSGNANSGSPKGEEALFEVCDRDGQPVFAVYDDGIVVYVDETAKAKRSGFVVTGRSTKDGESTDYFSVDAEGTHVYVDGDNSKVKRSGLVVSGRTAKGAGGSYAAERTAGKSSGADLFAVESGITHVYIDGDESKAKRSGFVVTGRSAKNGSLVDIYGDHTNLNTAALKIGSPTDEVSAMQLSEERFEFGNDVTYGGDVRPVIEVDEDLVYKIYMSDAAQNVAVNDYTLTSFDGSYQFPLSSLVEDVDDFFAKFYSPATFHYALCVPVPSDNAVILFNRRGEETSIMKDAVAAVFVEYYSINVWPLEKLSDYNFSFAMTDYKQTSAYSGKASKYASFDITLNSAKPYAGCYLQVMSPNNAYTMQITSKAGLYEPEISPATPYNTGVVYGETLTMAVSEAPAGQVLDSWYYSIDNEIFRRSSDSILRLPVTTRNIMVYPLFKDISPIVYVDGENGDDTNGDGTNTNGKQFKTIARALTAILDSSDNTRRGFCIDVQNYSNSTNQIINVGQTHNGRAKHITINLNDNSIAGINVLTSVPVIVKNGNISPQQVAEGSDPSAIYLSGTKLTLEGVVCDGNNLNMHGAVVHSGELVLTRETYIQHFISQNGGGVFVDEKAKLTLNQWSGIDGNTATEKGGGVYLRDNATLSLKGSSTITSNIGYGNGSGVYMVDGSTLVVSGGIIDENVESADVYVKNGEDGSNFIIEKASIIGYVALEDGACVKVNTKEFLAGGYEDFIEDPSVGLYTIENPNAVAVKLDNDNITDEQKDQIFSIFEVADETLLANGYSPEIGLDGKPFLTKKIYTTGLLSIFTDIQDDITYTYYHGEGDDEYLYLQHNFYDDQYEIRKYWLVDNKIYCDNAFIGDSYGTRPLNSDYTIPYPESPTITWQTDWDYFVFARDDNKDLLKIDANALSDYTTQEQATGDILYMEGATNRVAWTRNNIVREIHNINLFKTNLSGFKNLLKRAIMFDGINRDINDLTELNWWVDGDNDFLLFGNDVSTTAVEEQNLPRIDSPDDIEWMFKQLRRGFHVYIGKAPGGKVIDRATGYEFDDTKLYPYGTKLTLEAVPIAGSGTSFVGWEDLLCDTCNVCEVVINSDIELMPKFKQTKFYVNAAKGSKKGNGTQEKPFANIAQVKSALTEDYLNHDITIIIDGKLEGEQLLDQDFMAGSITICGLTGNTADSIIGEQMETTYGLMPKNSCLKIETTSPVIIKNLKITKGGGHEVYKGGGIYCADGCHLTLDDGALVTKNYVCKYGGGVYLGKGATLVMNKGAEISNNSLTQGLTSYGGVGVYIDGDESEIGTFIMNGGTICDHTNQSVVRGAVSLNYANFTMSDGKITNNHTQFVAPNIYASHSTLNISGGEISHGQTDGNEINSGLRNAAGGAIYLENGSALNLSGNTVIFGNILSPLSNGDNAYGQGGAIYVGSNCELNMSGGTIRDNYVLTDDDKKIAQGGAIYCAGEFNIGGSAYIPVGESGLNDVFICSGKLININSELEQTGTVATITMESYTETQVLTGDLVETEYEKFAVTRNKNGKQWFILSDGLLYEYEEINTITTSANITDPSKSYLLLGQQGNNSKQIDINSDADTEDGTTYYVSLNNVNRRPNNNESGLTIYNKTREATLNVIINLIGTNSIDGSNHGGLKLTSGSYSLGGTINVVFDTESEGTFRFKTYDYGRDGKTDLDVERVTGNISIAEGCTFSGTIKNDDTGVEKTYSNPAEFFNDARSNTGGDDGGCSFTLRRQ